ncbi:MAG TPA: hypothetical protein VIL85_08940 [Thermomicrobiales bacterium]|jgi:hypothetical protein
MDEEELPEEDPEVLEWEQILVFASNLRDYASLRAARARTKAQKTAAQRRWRQGKKESAPLLSQESARVAS